MGVVRIGVGCNVGAQMDGTQHAAQVAATWIKRPDIMIVQNRKLGSEDHFIYIIQDVIKQVQNQVKKVIDNDNFPLIIGGDHSIVMGSLPYKQDTLLVWIDAHADLNTFETSLTHRIHGMPLAHLMGFGDERLLGIIEKPFIEANQVVFVGVRDLDEKENDFLTQRDMLNLDHHQDRKQIIEALLKKTAKFKHIHISFDMDALDPEYAPGVSTPVKDGIQVSQAKEILEALFNTNKVRSMDIVEFNPLVETRLTVNVLKQLVEIVEKYK